MDRYGSMSCGIRIMPNGDQLLVSDVVNELEKIMSDDTVGLALVEKLLKELKKPVKGYE